MVPKENEQVRARKIDKRVARVVEKNRRRSKETTRIVKSAELDPTLIILILAVVTSWETVK
jgi:hypothetical protein